MSKRELTEKQKLFLEVLFGDTAKGDVIKAKTLAGYSPDYATSSLVASLRDELVEATRDFIARNGPKAAISMVGVLDNATEPGVKHKIIASKDILDRMGVVKVEKIDVSGSGIFILPAKKEE